MFGDSGWTLDATVYKMGTAIERGASDLLGDQDWNERVKRIDGLRTGWIQEALAGSYLLSTMVWGLTSTSVLGK